MISIGNPYVRGCEEMVRSQEHTFGACSREMRSIVVEVASTLKNGVDRFLDDIDFMQESLVDCGEMASPEQPAIGMMDTIELFGDEMRKELERINRKVSGTQATGRQVEDMEDKERNDFKKRRIGSHGMTKQESASAGQRIGLKPKPALGGKEENKSERSGDHVKSEYDDERRGRHQAPRTSKYQTPRSTQESSKGMSKIDMEEVKNSIDRDTGKADAPNRGVSTDGSSFSRGTADGESRSKSPIQRQRNRAESSAKLEHKARTALAESKRTPAYRSASGGRDSSHGRVPEGPRTAG